MEVSRTAGFALVSDIAKPPLHLYRTARRSRRGGRWSIRSGLGQSVHGTVEAQNIHEAGVGRDDVFRVLRESIVQDLEAAHGLSALLEIGFGGGRDEFDGLGFGVGARDTGLSVAFGLQNFGLLLSLGLQNLALLDPFRFEYRGAFFSPGVHL